MSSDDLREFGNLKSIDRGNYSGIIPCHSVCSGMARVGIKTLFTYIPLVILSTIGNSLTPPDLDLTMTFSKPLKAIILVICGYALQCSNIYQLEVNTEYTVEIGLYYLNCRIVIIVCEGLLTYI
ncbi:hypothetical protein [Candidatus Nitrosocosmicus sp. R]